MTDSGTNADPVESSVPAARNLGFWQRNPGLVPPAGLLVPLALLALLIYLVNPIFLDGRNLFNVFRQIAIFLILGSGMTWSSPHAESTFPSGPRLHCRPVSPASS